MRGESLPSAWSVSCPARWNSSRANQAAFDRAVAEGANVVAIDPSVMDVFPDAKAVNEALRALAPVLRHHRKRRSA